MWFDGISDKYHDVKHIFVKTADDRRTEILRGPIVRTIIVLALPVIISSALHTGFNIVDTYWFGQIGPS